MPKLLKIVFTFKFHPLHAKISTPTGTPVHDEKVKELSSINGTFPNVANRDRANPKNAYPDDAHPF